MLPRGMIVWQPEPRKSATQHKREPAKPRIYWLFPGLTPALEPGQKL